MVEAGLRCEKALDSKTTSPVLISISDTDGSRSSGFSVRREKTLAAKTVSNAEALGVSARTAAVSRAERFIKLFMKVYLPNCCDKDI